MTDVDILIKIVLFVFLFEATLLNDQVVAVLLMWQLLACFDFDLTLECLAMLFV